MVLVTNAMKMLFGRPRPALDEPLTFLSLWDSRPLLAKTTNEWGLEISGWVETFSWQFWHGRTANLWSMPSSHTAAAVLLAMIVSRMNPRLAQIGWTCAVMVGFNRVLVGMHYASDVAIGVVVGVVCVRGVFDRCVIDRIRWMFLPPNQRPISSRVGRLPALANAVRIQRGEEAKPEQGTSEVGQHLVPPQPPSRG